MSRVKITVTTVGAGHDQLPTETMRKAIQQDVQAQINAGRTLRAGVSRGGAVYLVYAEKVKGER